MWDGVYLSEVVIKNFRQFGSPTQPFRLELQPGVTALVGENDSGKTAVIDAIRYALLTRDVDFMRVGGDDFHVDARKRVAAEITIRCKLAGLEAAEKGAFAEYLTYEAGQAVLYVFWHARRTEGDRSPRIAEVTVQSGPDGNGPSLDLPIRQLLAAAYLRPLRDAEREMSPGQGSRLSRVLKSYPGIGQGDAYDDAKPPQNSDDASKLSLVGMSDYMRELVNRHDAVTSAQATINTKYLSQLALAGENLHGKVSFADAGNPAYKLRQILERLQLNLLDGPDGDPRGRYGLGSNNLLYMACELLLLGKEEVDGLRLLLIEEPEAHLQPQRQLRLMDFLLSEAADGIDGSRPVQVLVTTHSPNLSSRLPLKNLVLIDQQRAFVLAEGKTKLGAGDYRFLQRFLDVTKANLFFARGVLVVEGDAETILLPCLAKLLGRDLTEHGVSIVNVGSTGLRRYARIFQRADEAEGQVSVPVACLADLDVMPDCAPEIIGRVKGEDDEKWKDPNRRWQAMKDLSSDQLRERRDRLNHGDGGPVRTFISDQWTFEYALAFAGLAKEVFTAAMLALSDDRINDGKVTRDDVEKSAAEAFQQLETGSGADREVLCSHVYKLFEAKGASKAIAAQYLAEILEQQAKVDERAVALQSQIPQYVKDAIAYVTDRSLDVAEPNPATKAAS